MVTRPEYNAMRRWQGRVFHGLDGDVGAKLRESALGDAANGQEVFDAAEGAALLAEVEDGLGGDRADAGEGGQLLERGGVEVEGRGRRFLLGERRCESADQQRRSKKKWDSPCQLAPRERGLMSHKPQA